MRIAISPLFAINNFRMGRVARLSCSGIRRPAGVENFRSCGNGASSTLPVLFSGGNAVTAILHDAVVAVAAAGAERWAAEPFGCAAAERADAQPSGRFRRQHGHTGCETRATAGDGLLARLLGAAAVAARTIVEDVAANRAETPGLRTGVNFTVCRQSTPLLKRAAGKQQQPQ